MCSSDLSGEMKRKMRERRGKGGDRAGEDRRGEVEWLSERLI